MTRIRKSILGLLPLLLAASPTFADDARWRFGTEIDLLPYLSDGYSVSAIVGKGRFRGRLVRSEVTTPDFVTDDDFRDNDLEVVALVVDVFRDESQTGWWLGAGLEMWDGRVTEKASGLSRTYETTVLTAGAGYVWRFRERFTVNPWIGVHTPLGGDWRVRFPSHEFSIDTAPEASLKVGLSF